MRARTWARILVGLQVADIGSTLLAIRAGAHEGNPLVSAVVAGTGGWAVVLGLKVAMACLIYLGACAGRTPRRYVQALVVLYAGIVTWNLTLSLIAHG